jgi:hypothetical protein
MKYNSLILFILLLEAQAAFAQPEPVKRRYKISITDSAYRQTEGYLFKISDTTVQMSYGPIRFAHEAIRENIKEVSYSEIQEIALSRNHGAGRGAWKGAIIGALIGVAAGFIDGDEMTSDYSGYTLVYTATQKAVICGATGAAVGTGIGALIGASAKMKFTIGGNKERFDEMKANVLYKTYGPK